MNNNSGAFIIRVVVARLLTSYKRWTNPDLEVSSIAEDKWMTSLVILMIMLVIIGEFVKIWQKFRRQTRDDNESDEERQRHRDNLQKRILEILQERDHECPICLGDANFPVMTNCGHIFCCSCIIRYWKQSKTIFNPCDCAYCRCTFYKLFPIRWPSSGISDEIDDQLQKSNEELEDYNKRFSIERLPMDTIRDVPGFIINHIKDYIRDNFGWIDLVRLVVLPVCAVAYACYQCGTLPDDTYPVLRFFDDWFLTIYLIPHHVSLLRDYLADRGYSPIFINVVTVLAFSFLVFIEFLSLKKVN